MENCIFCKIANKEIPGKIVYEDDLCLAFLDVDGTLVDYHNRIPESAVKAIRQAREKGHLVYVCTGRSKAEMQPELWEIGLDGMIGGNGSYVEHHGQVLMHQLISKEDAAKIVDWLTERHLAFYLERLRFV